MARVERRVGARGAAYRVRVETAPEAGTGKRRWLSGTYPTREAAARGRTLLEARATRERAQASGSVPAGVTVGEYLVEWWLPAYGPTVRPRTRESRARDVRLHLVPTLGHHRLDRLAAPQIAAVHRALLARGMAPVSVQRIHAALSRALALAVEWGVLDRNPSARVTPPTAERREYRLWSAAETARFLAATAETRLGPLWAVIAATGVRRGEALGLVWGDVDLDAGVMAIRRAGTKTRAGVRVIRLPAVAAAALATQRQRQDARRAILGGGWRGAAAEGRQAVFDREDGRPLPEATFNDAFAREARAAGLAPIRPHDLRHGWATAMVRAGVPIRTVSTMLGHGKIQVTLDTYAHLGVADQDAAIAAAEAAFGGGVTERVTESAGVGQNGRDGNESDGGG